jgi:hypothetical protein
MRSSTSELVAWLPNRNVTAALKSGNFAGGGPLASFFAHSTMRQQFAEMCGEHVASAAHLSVTDHGCITVFSAGACRRVTGNWTTNSVAITGSLPGPTIPLALDLTIDAAQGHKSRFYQFGTVLRIS